MKVSKKEFIIAEDDICYEDPNIDEICFVDGDLKVTENTVALFTFSNDNNTPASFDKRNIKKEHSCLPEVEPASKIIRRTFSLTNSSIQKINYIKAYCPSCNLTLSNIVEKAIIEYYDNLQKQK